MPEGLSVREFAEKDGCSSSLVQRGKARGRIRTMPDGSLNPADVGTEWRESTRRTQTVGEAAQRAQLHAAPVHKQTGRPSPSKPVGEAALAEAALAAVTAQGGVYASRGEAETVRDSYIAHLRRIEFEQKSGRLVEVDRVVAKVEDAYNRVRTRLLAIPPEQAPRLQRCKTVLELQDALAAVITEVLEELSRD